VAGTEKRDGGAGAGGRGGLTTRKLSPVAKGTQFTCFTRTKGTQFTCFTSTKVRILTQLVAKVKAHKSEILCCAHVMVAGSPALQVG
jgi:hypothetical protein